MKTLLIHGPYDLKTVKTLKSFGVEHFAFDLRARSSNLIPFHHLKEILNEMKESKIYLSFENDRKETIHSFLNLLGTLPFQFTLIFRDKGLPELYQEVNHPFIWMFHPEGDWRTILALPNLRGVLLPLKWQNELGELTDFWRMVDARNLDVFIHAESFHETIGLDLENGVKISVDLTQEVEESFRKVDQEKLKRMKIWRSINESTLS